MTNTRFSKIINKTIILIVTLGLLCSMSVSAAVTLDADVTKDNATLTVSCGEDFAGKNIVVQVFEPTGTLDDLLGDDGEYSETDAGIIDNALVCVYHGKLDSNGQVSFTVAPTGPKGVYGVRISVKNIYEVIETEFVFSSEDDAGQIVEKLEDNLNDDAVAEVLKKDTDISDRVYQSYQILSLDGSIYYGEYEDIAYDTKTLVHKNIVKNYKEGSTPQEFVTLFEDAVIVEKTDILTGELLKEYIETNAERTGLAERGEYKNIYCNAEEYTEEDKLALMPAIEALPLSGKTVKDLADGFCEEILVTLLPGDTTAPGVVDEFILDFADTLESNGARINDYKDFEQALDLCDAITDKAPFQSIKEFVDAINDSLDEMEDDSDDDAPSRPSGSTTGTKTEGSFGGGGGGGTSYTPKEDVAEEPKEDAEPSQPQTVPVFTDIAGVEWAHEAIIALKDRDIVAGRGDGSFAPADKVTREEFVKMLSVALGLNTNAQTSVSFADVKGDEWFASYIIAAGDAGIVTGIDGSFGVGNNITRQDMAVLIKRAIDYKNITLENVREGMAFTDEFPEYAKDAIASLWGAGLVNGVSDTEFAPTATASRAEAAKMLYEMLKTIE